VSVSDIVFSEEGSDVADSINYISLVRKGAGEFNEEAGGATTCFDKSMPRVTNYKRACPGRIRVCIVGS